MTIHSLSRLCGGGPPNHPVFFGLCLISVGAGTAVGTLAPSSYPSSLVQAMRLGLQRPIHGCNPDLYPDTPQTELERKRKPLTIIGH